MFALHTGTPFFLIGMVGIPMYWHYITFLWSSQGFGHTRQKLATLESLKSVYEMKIKFVKSIKTFIIRCHKRNSTTCAVSCDFVW